MKTCYTFIMNKSKIICVVGAPRTGKSFLVRKLAEHYKAKAFFEGEDVDFPDRIKEDISKNIRPLERILWFRNKLVGQYKEALRLKKSGENVVSDSTYFAVDLYIDVLDQDVFEREILHDLAKSDENLLGMPDKVIHLISDEKTIREFIKKGGREFDAGEDFFDNQILPIQKAWEKYFSKNIDKKMVVEINRANLDFSNEKDFNTIISLIED